VRFSYLRSKLPQYKDSDEYQQQLSRALHESERDTQRALKELNNPPVLLMALITTNQSLVANTQTTVHFNSTVIDTGGWWSASPFVYTPQEAGFYRCAWRVRLVDSGAIAVGTSGVSKLIGPYEFSDILNGNGTGTQITSGGAAIIECNGLTDSISVSALLSAGSAPAIVAGSSSSYPTWLSVDYLGRRAL